MVVEAIARLILWSLLVFTLSSIGASAAGRCDCMRSCMTSHGCDDCFARPGQRGLLRDKWGRPECQVYRRSCTQKCFPPAECSSEEIEQSALDFYRGFMDGAIPGTQLLREQIWHDRGKIVDESPHTAGEWASLVTLLIPGEQGLQGARVTVRFSEFAQRAESFSKATDLSVEAARFFKANADLVWKLPGTLRGIVIERVEAILKFRPEHYDWIGIGKKGQFPLIDFINYVQHEQVSLKTIYRGTAGWASAVADMKVHINNLAGVSKVWRKELGEVEKTWHSWPSPNLSAECRSVLKEWRVVLDIRVPKGFEGEVQEVIKYGKDVGVEVRVSTF